jgi:hypothetical protein
MLELGQRRATIGSQHDGVGGGEPTRHCDEYRGVEASAAEVRRVLRR